MATIYVLRCAHGCWYVGKTGRPVTERFVEHIAGEGSEWTALHPPLVVEESFPSTDPTAEDATVKRYMARFGIAKVRGGSYCQRELEPFQLRALELELASAQGACFRCGRGGHLAVDCAAQSPPTVRVAAWLSPPNGAAHAGLGKAQRRGSASPTKRAVPYDRPRPRPVASPPVGCFRCGSTSHIAADCDTTTNLVGRFLGDMVNGAVALADSMLFPGRARPVHQFPPGSCYRCGRSSHYAADCYASTDVHGRPL